MATTQPSLITLAEYKTLQGIPVTNTTDDAQIQPMLNVGTAAVRSYTGRKFELADGTFTARSYQYDGEEMLDIDDCLSVTDVTTDVGVPGQSYTLTTDQWEVMPQDDSEVYYYLLIFGGFNTGSREMGFRYNLDTIGLRPRSPLISVTANWGWATIPDDVKWATSLTVAELVGSNKDGGGEGLSSESIEGWSRSWGSKSGSLNMAMAIPNRARDILANYQRLFA
jgi:hypothetical protein